ncbi:helix-turn-helix transcriptional regulator [Ochrobactrum sp. BTU1]|nr:helix-turn-helix transcriptional regulator [Ochrobactrum sp. BTU1]
MSVGIVQRLSVVSFSSIKITGRVIFIALKAVKAYAWFMITSDQIRAARAFLNWKQTDLAAAANISEMSVKNVEKGQTDTRVSTLKAIEQAFTAAGMEFINESYRTGIVLFHNKE